MCGGNRHWGDKTGEATIPSSSPVFYREYPLNENSTCERRFAECYDGEATASLSRQHRIAMALACAVRRGNMLRGTIFAGSRLEDGRTFVASASVNCDSPPVPAFVRGSKAAVSSVFWMMERRVALVVTLIKGDCRLLESEDGYLIVQF